jgi:hypothetical protein
VGIFYLTYGEKGLYNRVMKVKGGEYITVKEMADILETEPNTIKQRLFQHNIKPLSRDALYEVSAFEIIKNTVMGRPKKEQTNKPAKRGKTTI